MLTVLRTFVRERGIGLDPDLRAARRLRTVVFSCQSFEQALQIADDIVVIEPTGSAVMHSAEDLRRDATARASIASSVSLTPSAAQEAPPSPEGRAPPSPEGQAPPSPEGRSRWRDVQRVGGPPQHLVA
jgi:hypothetical protein